MASKNFSETVGAEQRTNALLFDPEKLHIVTDERHPLYDPRHALPVDPALVASIAAYGVVEPIIVWRDPETQKTCVVDGRGRVQAARIANKQLADLGRPIRLVAAVSRHGKARDVMAPMAIANEGRREVTAISRAHRAQRLQAEGYSGEEIATILHVSASGLRDILALLGATDAVQEAVKSGEVTQVDARKLAKLPPEAQRAKLATMQAATKVEPGEAPLGKRARAEKVREVMGETKIRSRSQIQRRLEDLSVFPKNAAHCEALAWVLGEREELP